MQIDILSLFPEYFKSSFEQSILRRAIEKGLLRIDSHDIRNWAEGKHRQVDNRPYGGGPGMVMMAEPVTRAIRETCQPGAKVIALTPRGKPLSADLCRQLAQEKALLLLCGHYEGIDERVFKKDVIEEISIGDYVLTNGCLAALVLIDAMARFIPGVLGHEEAASQDSFEKGLLDCPHYTRPEEFEGERVPEVLLSGDHKKIAEWRLTQAIEQTRDRRPDIYERFLEMKKMK